MRACFGKRGGGVLTGRDALLGEGLRADGLLLVELSLLELVLGAALALQLLAQLAAKPREPRGARRGGRRLGEGALAAYHHHRAPATREELRRHLPRGRAGVHGAFVSLRLVPVSSVPKKV